MKEELLIIANSVLYFTCIPPVRRVLNKYKSQLTLNEMLFSKTFLLLETKMKQHFVYSSLFFLE